MPSKTYTLPVPAKAVAITKSGGAIKTKDHNVEADCKEFGQRLLAAMDKAGVTQAELSRAMNVSRSAVNWWVQGNTYPSIDNAKRLADLLRTTPEHLLFGAVKVPRERLVDSIPVVDRIHGKTVEITRITIPKEFAAKAHLPSNEHLRAVTIFNDGRTDIAIADTSDKTLSVRKPKLMVLNNPTGVSIGKVWKKRGDPSTITIETDGKAVDMPYRERLFVGRLAASLTAIPA